jgi:hypothetical protein
LGTLTRQRGTYEAWSYKVMGASKSRFTVCYYHSLLST